MCLGRSRDQEQLSQGEVLADCRPLGWSETPALVAVAPSLLGEIYEVLRTGQPYQGRHASRLPALQKQRLIRHHLRRLGKLGVTVRCNSSAVARAKET